MSDSKINTKQASKTNWLVWVIIGSSIPITFLVMATLIKLLASAIPSLQQLPLMDINDTTIENAIFFGGLYLALPCGLLNIIAGIFAQSRSLVKKKVAITGIIIGVFGILIGILAWAWFYAISQIVF